MALVKAAARLILEEHQRRAFREPVLCLGVPDVYITERELHQFTGESGGSGSFVSGARFLSSLGLSDIVSIDIPGSVHDPDVIHDLNQPLPRDMEGTFGLVIDPGTTEHIFDMRTAMVNIASALKVGGTVVHFVPIYSYNGGYFSINPNVLHDFYTENGFDGLVAYIVMWDRYRPFGRRSRCYRYTDRLEARHALADYDQCRYTPHLLLFATKRDAVTEYRSPIQSEPDHTEQVPSSGPVKGVLRRVLPEDVLTWLSAWRSRRHQLRESRRDSFWA